MKTTNLTKQEFFELTNKAIASFKKDNCGIDDKGIQQIKTTEDFETIIKEKAMYGKYGTFAIYFAKNTDKTFDLFHFGYSYFSPDEWSLHDEEIEEGEF